jgi:hypothetical protein
VQGKRRNGIAGRNLTQYISLNAWGVSAQIRRPYLNFGWPAFGMMQDLLRHVIAELG